MSLAAKLRRAPVRIATGAHILNSGISKLSADEDTAKALHGMASGTYPFLGRIDPKVFAKALAAGEIAVGGALLLPIVSPIVAGGALLGFSGALLNLYRTTPGMHQEGSLRPTPQGTAISKDVWLFGIGAGLVADALLEPAHDKKVEIAASAAGRRRGRQDRKARRQARKARRERVAYARDAALIVQAETSERAQKAARKAQKAAWKARKQASKRLTAVAEELRPVVADKAKHAVDVAKVYVDEYGPVVADKARHAVDAAKVYVDEYGPVAAEKAKAAADTARGYVDEYGPVAAEKAKAAADTARGYVDEYGPVAAEKARQARDAAQDAAMDVTKRAKTAAGR